MSQVSRYRGAPVSDGVAAGRLHPCDPTAVAVAATADQVEAAFAAVARERAALARRLRRSGRAEQADIVAIGALIAADAALIGPAVSAVRDGVGAVTAIERSADTQAAAIAALANPDMAERAADVRQVASAVLEHLAGGARAHPDGNFILVCHEVDPADLIRLADDGLVGAVSVTGGASSHAAIIARGLGVPMLAGVDPAVLASPAGHQAIIDTRAGELIVGPLAGEFAAISALATSRAGNGHGGARPEQVTPPRTRDGHEITLLCNVASAAETRLGLAAGAAGVGLLRTEIPFTAAHGWPSPADHQAKLAPVLRQLTGRRAVVRLLDFSGDKVPPFLAREASGLAAFLGHPSALPDQLHAVLRAGRDTRLAILVPMVSAVTQVRRVRAVLADVAAEEGCGTPELGIMVEIASTAAAAGEFAREVDFFSIGTNDLAGHVLGLDRRDPRARPALAADPRVLGLVAGVVKAAQTAGVMVSVCGDAAADPAVLPLLIGLGVEALSVPAAQLAQVARWVSELDRGSCAVRAAQALQADALDRVPPPVRSQ